MATLRSVLREWTDTQTEASAAICARRGIPFVDVAHCDLDEGFWADDGFHPSAAGYEMAAGMVARVMLDALAAGPDGGAGAVPGVVLPQAGDDDAAHLGALDEQVVGELEEVVGVPGEVVVDDDAGAGRGARQAVGLLQPGQGAVGPRPGGGRRGARGAHRCLT